MGWYNKNYKKRQMIGVDVFGGTGIAATIDIEVEVPSDWDTFWDEIRSDFLDVVVTDPSGKLVKFARSGANYANRTLTLQIDAYSSNNDDSMNALWIYYGYANESVDSSVAVTITSAKTGYILLERPYSRIVPSVGGQSATDAPITSFNKGANDEVDIFFLTSGLLGRRIDNYNERDFFEAVDYVTIASYDNAGANDATRYDETETRLGNNFVRARYKLGDTGSDYAVTVQIVTTEKQIIESRAILRVKTLLPD